MTVAGDANGSHEREETNMTTVLRKIDKRTARALYDAGHPIAMAGESWWFGIDHPGSVITKVEMTGKAYPS